MGRPLTRPRTNSLLSSKIRDDVSSACVTAPPAASSELSSEEQPADQTSQEHSSDEHGSLEAAGGPGHSHR